MRTILGGLLASLLLLGSLPSHANTLEVVAMAPDHVGMTVRKSPVLYFYISDATKYLFLFTLDSRRGPLLFEAPLPSPTHSGFWPIRLEDYHVELEEGIQYRWYVSVSAHDLAPLAGGTIERVNPRDVNYQGRGCDQDSFLQAEKAGVWYDALACLNELIEANPQDPSFRRMRSALLKDVGIILPTAN